MNASIPLSRPNVGDLEIQYVTDVLRSGMLSLGPRVPEFENRFASYVGRKHAVAVNSGTSALHLCIRAMGIGPEDEVITSSFSFVASTNCILYEGGVPVLQHPATLGGTRHLSAAQFVHDQRNAVALIASQDGRFTVFAWSPCEELVHAHRVETLLL